MKKTLFTPGRTELAGNHTDHQNGRVLALAKMLGFADVDAMADRIAEMKKEFGLRTDLKDFNTFNDIYAEYFPQKPARSCVQVAALPKGALVECECVCVR